MGPSNVDGGVVDQWCSVPYHPRSRCGACHGSGNSRSATEAKSWAGYGGVLGLNGVIGSGVFFMPGSGAALMGPAVLLALVIGGLLCFLISLCFAEVGGRFRSTGGAYLYAREAFGDFVGFEVGWMTCCVAVISWAALANGFTKALSFFIPVLGSGWAQTACSCGAVLVLTAINLMGARSGANVVSFLRWPS